jgi:hypothetical protein
MSKKALWLQLPKFGGPAPDETPGAELDRYRKGFSLRNRTPARAREERIYNQQVKEWLRLPENKWCQVYLKLSGLQVRATQCHHFQGRRGMLLLYKPYWIPVSAEGHAWINDNPERARELGLLCPLGLYNSPVKLAA